MRRFERVGAVEEHLVGLLDRLVTGDAGDDDGLCRRLHLLDLLGGVGVGVAGGEPKGGGAHGAERQEVAACGHGGFLLKHKKFQRRPPLRGDDAEGRADHAVTWSSPTR